jgi:hypothetical protein
MWVSKKKLAKIEREQYLKAMNDEIRSNSEYRQEERIEKLAREVKKLKKIVKQGY